MFPHAAPAVCLFLLYPYSFIHSSASVQPGTFLLGQPVLYVLVANSNSSFKTFTADLISSSLPEGLVVVVGGIISFSRYVISIDQIILEEDPITDSFSSPFLSPSSSSSVFSLLVHYVAGYPSQYNVLICTVGINY